MALSQLQCLDDNHVNPRTHESKPEFFYCEDQRLALELLLRDGREAFVKYLEARGLRGFLSDPELETLVGAVEPYDPGSELFPGNAEDSEPPLSLHYWPDLSDTSVPNMDLGWPDSESYRGVTRTTVYAQPPLEGQAHVKEVVRKMIAQAQKVIAVVMDVFTDVDIFRDLLDAGFKRKVSVYILLERTTLPHFLSMCRRANMHAGHLKNLRVRCTEGAEFHTRSCTKVTGRMGHRFMFVDGDKAVSGSYSFTWMSSRLDRNIVTVITGQAVEAFDRLFRFLYVTSSSVALGQVATEPEPELEPLPQPAAVVLPSAALARKLHNPKYALVAAANPTPAAERNSPKEPSKNPESNKRRQNRASKEAVQDVPPLHPGLTDLEKACLIEYLPTWPEPDPASDVIGFINIRDAKKPTQVHLQRSEMFETSQAIRFSSPISIPKEILPVVAKPRQLSAEPKQMFKPQPTPDDTEAGESPPVQPSDIKCNKEEETEQETPASRKKTESAKDTAVLTTENNLQPSTLASHDAGHSALPHVAAHTPPESTNNQGPSYNTHITTNSAKPESRPGPHTEIAVGTSSNTQSVELRTEDLESNTTQSPHVQVPSSSNTEHHTKEITELPLTTSHRQAAHTQPQISEMTSNIQAPTLQSHITTTSPSEIHSQSDSPSSLSENSLIPVTTSITANVCGPSIVSPSPQTVQPSHLSSTASPSLLPPVPKPRTVQLVIKHGGTSDGNNLPEISVVRKTENLESAELDVANVVQLPPETEKETLTELYTSEAGPQKDTESAGKPEEAPQQQQRVTFQETKREEAVGPHDNKAETQAQSDILITDAPKAGNGNTLEIIPEEVDPERLPQTDCEITSKTQTEQTATIRIDADASEKAQTDCECVQVPNEKNNNEPQHSTHHPRAKEAQRITPCETNPQDKGLLENGNSHSPLSNSSISHRADDNKDCPQENADLTDDNANMIKQSMVPNTICQKSQQAPKARGGSHTPERPLCLRLSDTHVRDLRLPASDQEPQSPTSLSRRATPDGFLSCTSTPDSRTYTPGPRSFTPDFRTPPDGYVSPRDDSPLSTTSEEYYECSDSIPHDPGSDSVAYCNHETTEDRVIFSNTTATTIPATTISAACMLGTADSNELQRLPGPVSISSSSVLERKAKIGAEEKTVNEENGREEDEKERNVAERRTEQGSYGTETKSSEEAKKTADQLQTEMVEKDNVSQTQAPNRKKGLSISASESSADGEVTQGMDPKRLSSDALTPDDVSSEVEKANKETVADKARSSGVDKRDRAQTTRESDGQKILHSLRKLSQGKQQETGCSSSSQPPRPPRLISAIRPLGTRPWGSHQTNLAESKVPSGSSQALDNASSHRRPASRPPPPLALGAAGFTAEQKRARLSRSQQSLVSLDLSAQGRTRGGQSQNESSQIKPQSGPEAHRQEGARSPFTITFGRLYSLKGLKEKMSKPPAQSRRGSTSSPLQRHKSTS